ncbi:hypothetical protein DYB30_011888 [Aphanomyces astaci]|uniref:Uncharacterized protein n=1 Tax=Aphanomyces astaci TaxID=112090 RepID=A0A397EAM6_APHAT|nr:hypothetical protein DYB30_011888 [Aphanomyces astaci]RHY54103.1 hypothetical protein DYB34_011720 [Aphanomyces astaci]RHY79190.1 hypothetical protein DYB31_009393 [Aphanomyces astaci]RHZ42265.1 hypothetical protein DYB26_007562 [Aphanomyces astaci]
MCLSNEVFELDPGEQAPAEIWNTLVVNFETKSNTIYGLRRLGQMRYDPKSDMMKHITQVRSTIRDLNDMGKGISEQETIEWILISLPDVGPNNYNTFMNHLKPTPDHKVTLKALIRALLTCRMLCMQHQLRCKMSNNLYVLRGTREPRAITMDKPLVKAVDIYDITTKTTDAKLVADKAEPL